MFVYLYSLARKIPVLSNYIMYMYNIDVYVLNICICNLYICMYHIYAKNMHEIVCMLVIVYLHRHVDIRHLSLPRCPF